MKFLIPKIFLFKFEVVRDFYKSEGQLGTIFRQVNVKCTVRLRRMKLNILVWLQIQIISKLQVRNFIHASLILMTSSQVKSKLCHVNGICHKILVYLCKN